MGQRAPSRRLRRSWTAVGRSAASLSPLAARFWIRSDFGTFGFWIRWHRSIRSAASGLGETLLFSLPVGSMASKFGPRERLLGKTRQRTRARSGFVPSVKNRAACARLVLPPCVKLEKVGYGR